MVTRGKVKTENADINAVKIMGVLILFMKSNETYFFRISTGINKVDEIKTAETGQPISPSLPVVKGTRIQVRIVQKTINPRVFFIFPRAFNAFTRGLEKADRRAEIAKR